MAAECADAFACTEYKAQGRTLGQVALEPRGTTMTKVSNGVLSQCDPYRGRGAESINQVVHAQDRDSPYGVSTTISLLGG